MMFQNSCKCEKIKIKKSHKSQTELGLIYIEKSDKKYLNYPQLKGVTS